MRDHRFNAVFVCDIIAGRQVVGYVAACGCGWSGTKVKDHSGALRQWRSHEASRSYWDPILAKKRDREIRARCAAAVLERVRVWTR